MNTRLDLLSQLLVQSFAVTPQDAGMAETEAAVQAIFGTLAAAKPDYLITREMALLTLADKCTLLAAAWFQRVHWVT